MLRISRIQAEVMAATDLKLVPASKQAKLPWTSKMEESKMRVIVKRIFQFEDKNKLQHNLR
jgi:hypothetical protein